jgi:hypothetical protein
LNRLCIVFEQGIITVSIAKSARHCNHVYLIKEHIFNFVSAEQFEVVAIAQGMHYTIAALYRASGIMDEQGYGGFHGVFIDAKIVLWSKTMT